MGTSQSYRAPNTSRWAAFVTAIASGAPLDRVRSELFNAGNEWQEALSSAAVASFATTVEALHADMPRRLVESQSTAAAVSDALAEARLSSHEAGFSAAVSLAERALGRYLLTGVVGSDSPEAAAAQWLAHRGQTPQQSVASFLGEVLAQYARHVTDREAGRLAESRIGAGASARLADDVARQSAALVESITFRADVGRASEAWPQLVAAAFETGRVLPRGQR